MAFGIAWFVSSIGGASPYEVSSAIPYSLSIFHSTFNILNTLLLIGFVPIIVKLANKMVKAKDDEGEEEFRLQFIGTGILSTSELSIVQAKKEIAVYARRCCKMFSYVKHMFSETNGRKNTKLFEKISQYENIVDRMEIEIASYLTRVSEGEISHLGSKRVRAMLKIISDLESIGDSCLNMAIVIDKKGEEKSMLTENARGKMDKMFNLVDEAFTVMCQNLESEYSQISITQAKELEEKINKYRDTLRFEHGHDLENKECNYETSIFYTDIYSQCEKLGDFIINISEAILDVQAE